jgi:hypothetical protein
MSFDNFGRLVQKKMKEAKQMGKQGTKVQSSRPQIMKKQENSTPKKGCCGRWGKS